MSETGSSDDETEVSSIAGSFSDGPECMTKDLIAMILQYMEASGLHDSYKSFWNECDSFGYPMPSEGQSALLDAVDFGPREANLLFKYFDLEEKENLLTQWDKFIKAIDPDQQEDFQKITFFVRIFASTIPFRKNEPEARKAQALAELRDFFQQKTDEFSTDEKMLSLFALPFIADPASHPVFKEIFQDAWKTKLRSQVSLSVRKFCEFKNLPTIGSTDLVQLYLSQQEELQDEDTHHDKSRCVSSCRQQEQLSGRRTAHPTLQSIHNSLKSTESTLLDVELRYHKLLKVTAEMVGALESAVQGKEQDMVELRDRVINVFPELFNAFHRPPQTENCTTAVSRIEGSDSDEPSYAQSQSDSEDDPKSPKCQPQLRRGSQDDHSLRPNNDDEDEQDSVPEEDCAHEPVSQYVSNPPPETRTEFISPLSSARNVPKISPNQPSEQSKVLIGAQDSSRRAQTRAIPGNKHQYSQGRDGHPPKAPTPPHRVKVTHSSVDQPSQNGSPPTGKKPPVNIKVSPQQRPQQSVSQSNMERSKSQTRKRLGPGPPTPTPPSMSKETPKLSLSRKPSKIGQQQQQR